MAGCYMLLKSKRQDYILMKMELTKLKEMDKSRRINLERANVGAWLRSFKGCEHHTDEEAMEVYASLKTLAEFLLVTQPFVSQQIDYQLASDLHEEEYSIEENLKIAA